MTIGRTTMWWLLAAGAGLAGCGTEGGDAEDRAVPGLYPPSCTMTWAAYAVTSTDLPVASGESAALGLDVDQRERDGVDNILGGVLAAMASLYPESWDAEGSFNAKLDAGVVRWVLEVGTCTDGDEVRVVSAQATDADGDGVLELGDRGVASVGERGGETRRGIGWVPVGSLFAGSATAGTDAWQRGLSLTTDLAFDADTLDGRFAIGLMVETPAVLTPVARFFTERLLGGASPYADSLDRNDDRTIDLAEAEIAVRTLVADDLDLGACDEVACYRPLEDDEVRDHASLGIGIHAARVAVE